MYKKLSLGLLSLKMGSFPLMTLLHHKQMDLQSQTLKSLLMVTIASTVPLAHQQELPLIHIGADNTKIWDLLPPNTDSHWELFKHFSVHCQKGFSESILIWKIFPWMTHLHCTCNKKFQTLNHFQQLCPSMIRKSYHFYSSLNSMCILKTIPRTTNCMQHCQVWSCFLSEFHTQPLVLSCLEILAMIIWWKLEKSQSVHTSLCYVCFKNIHCGCISI